MERIPSIERVLPWIVGLLVAGALVAMFVLHLAEERVEFVVAGVVCLLVAWMVAWHGVVAYSYEKTSYGSSAEMTRVPPLVRLVLTPLLAVAAVGFIVAASSTGASDALREPAHDALSTWGAIEGLGELAGTALFVLAVPALLGYGLVKRDAESLEAAGCLGGLVLLGVAINGVYFLIDADGWRSAWSDGLAPLRQLIDVFR